MANNNNHEVYSNVLLNDWQTRSYITPYEEYIIEKYLKNKNQPIIEAGCGGGRIVFYLEDKGYTNLYGFDFVKEMIDFANEKAEKSQSKINFKVADMTGLHQYEDNSFDIALYFQQLLSFIPVEKAPITFSEAKRILKPGGIAAFVMLNYETHSKAKQLIISFLQVIRFLMGSKLTRQYTPWFKYVNKFNWLFWSPSQAQNYSYKKEEIRSLAINAGFEVLELKSGDEIREENPTITKHNNFYYLVVKK